MTVHADIAWRNRPVPRLWPGDIHVWQLSVFDNSQDESIWGLLDPAERERAASFRFETDRWRYVMAHGSLRRVLGGYLGRDPRMVTLGRSVNGKPVLGGGASRMSGLGFSLSHDHDLVLIAVARFASVGVDVQSEAVAGRIEVMAETVLSSHEQALLRGTSRLGDRSTLLQIWARKEAMVKATGTGLGGWPKRGELIGDSPVSVKASGRLFPMPLRVYDVEVGSGYEAAVAGPPWCRRVLGLRWDSS